LQVATRMVVAKRGISTSTAGQVLIIMFLLVLLAAGMFGCRDSAPLADDARGISQELSKGEIEVHISTDRKELTTAELLQLEITVRAPEGIEVTTPKVPEKEGGFRVIQEEREKPLLLDSGMIELNFRYQLEPFLPGLYIIEPITIAYRLKRWAKEQTSEISSEPMEIEVTSLLGEGNTSSTLRDIAPPLELARPVSHWLGWGLLVLAAIFFAFLLLRWLRRGKREQKISLLPPHQRALQALEKLLARGLVEKREYKPLYRELSDILRDYIEERFGLHAPERTTEEFMEDLRTTTLLAPQHKSLLKEFLEHCDQVKFAEHLPSTEELQRTVDACRQFIEETKIEEGEESAL
jgi:hypothetical protein